MKRIVTEEYQQPIVLNLSEIKTLIEELPYSSHVFVVYSEDGDTSDYVQTIMAEPELDEESPYQVEARVYHSPDSFSHYRTYVNTAAEAYTPFEAFYNNTPYRYDQWDDVTHEFTDNY
ncbi:hypothetical protein RCZ04_08790 [Capnocytophaga sp. HP1101]